MIFALSLPVYRHVIMTNGSTQKLELVSAALLNVPVAVCVILIVIFVRRSYVRIETHTTIVLNASLLHRQSMVFVHALMA